MVSIAATLVSIAKCPLVLLIGREHAVTTNQPFKVMMLTPEVWSYQSLTNYAPPQKQLMPRAGGRNTTTCIVVLYCCVCAKVPGDAPVADSLGIVLRCTPTTSSPRRSTGTTHTGTQGKGTLSSPNKCTTWDLQPDTCEPLCAATLGHSGFIHHGELSLYKYEPGSQEDLGPLH